MVTLQNTPSVRLFPLPAIFNWRRPSIHSVWGPVQPMIVQAHLFANTTARIDKYREIAYRAAGVMMRDCLSHLTRGDKQHHYLCDGLLTA